MFKYLIIYWKDDMWNIYYYSCNKKNAKEAYRVASQEFREVRWVKVKHIAYTGIRS